MLIRTLSLSLLPPCRERRRDELVSLQQRIGEEFANKLVGRTVEVLVDGYNEEG